MTIFRFNLIAACLVASSCSSADQPAKRCADLLIAKSGKPELANSWLEQGVVNKRCIKGWSYKLAIAPGTNRDIAQAAAQACAAGVEYEAALLAERDLPEELRPAGKTAREKSLGDTYLKEALLDVVQARAGKCEDA